MKTITVALIVALLVIPVKKPRSGLKKKELIIETRSGIISINYYRFREGK